MPTPSVRRRLACFVYEGVLLFGVLMIAAYLFSSLTQQRHALMGRHLLQAFLFVILGIYFIWFWLHGGQTLAMQTWRVRLLRTDGGTLSQAQALLRYVLSWLWFGPALLLGWASGTSSPALMIASLIAGVLVYAAIACLHVDRQFAHDRICRTRLVSTTPPRPS